MSTRSGGRVRAAEKAARPAQPKPEILAAIREPLDAVAGVKAEPKRVRNRKRHTKQVIAEDFSQIVSTLAEKSKKGSLAHTKFLFEIGGVKEEIARQARSKSEPSLAKMLIAELRRRERAGLLPATAETRHELGDGTASEVTETSGDSEAGER